MRAEMLKMRPSILADLFWNTISLKKNNSDFYFALNLSLFSEFTHIVHSKAFKIEKPNDHFLQQE